MLCALQYARSLAMFPLSEGDLLVRVSDCDRRMLDEAGVEVPIAPLGRDDGAADLAGRPSLRARRNPAEASASGGLAGTPASRLPRLLAVP